MRDISTYKQTHTQSTTIEKINKLIMKAGIILGTKYLLYITMY